MAKSKKRGKQAKKSKPGNIKPPKQVNVRLWGLIVILLVTFVAFSPILTNDFINYDDNSIIYDNPVVTNDGAFDLKAIFTKQIYTPHYKPLTYLSWHLEHRLFGANATIFHLNNLILHLLNILLVFIVSIRLLKRFDLPAKHIDNIALVITLLFAIHPMKVESVAWAVERKDVLYGFFFLLSIWSYLKYIDRKTFKWLLFSILAFLLSLMAKSMGITLFLLLFLLDWIFHRKLNTKSILEKIPFLIIFILGFYFFGMFGDFELQASGLTAGITKQGFDHYPSNFDGLGAFYTRILIINIRIILWIIHLLLPFKLSAFYPQYEILNALGASIHLFPLLVMGLLVFGIIQLRKKTWSGFAIIFFLITLFPALAVSDNGIGVFLSDRYTYLPMFGLVFGLSIIFFKWLYAKNKIRLLYLLVGVIGVGYAIMTGSYSSKWKNSEVFWTNVIEISPNDAHPYNGRGRFYYDGENYASAISDFSNSIKNDPEYHVAYSNRGKAYFETGEYDKALADFTKTININDKYYEAWANRGLIYARQNNFNQAKADLDIALSLRPDHSNSLKNRGIVKMNQADYRGAIEDLSQYIVLEGEDDDIYNTIGIAYLNLKEYNSAVDNLTKAIQLNPQNGNYFKNRAYCYLLDKKPNKAKSDAQKAAGLGVPLPSDLSVLIRE